jgi:hypothetical protein
VISVCPTMLPPRCEMPPGGPWEGDAARTLDDGSPSNEAWMTALLRAVALGYVALGGGLNVAPGRCGCTSDAYKAAGFRLTHQGRLEVTDANEAGIPGGDFLLFCWSMVCTDDRWGWVPAAREWECSP